MDLNDQQQERVNELLQRRDLACPQCGSTMLASTGIAFVTMDRRISVQYICTNSDIEHPDPTGFGPWSVPLDPQEAQRIGIG
jgi:predicted RNA-binding Zn-ribbon protein involved in translation (DUF1610 family)